VGGIQNRAEAQSQEAACRVLGVLVRRVDLVFLPEFNFIFFRRDSVNSVGTLDPIKLAYTATNGIVRTFRHAVALDERRAKFKQNMWSKPKNQLPGADAPPNGANANGPLVTTDVQEVWFAGCHCGASILHRIYTVHN
jgi:uncharacterized protein (DUF2235 family)